MTRVVAWEADRIVLAHGDVIAPDGSAVVRNGYRWLQRSNPGRERYEMSLAKVM